MLIPLDLHVASLKYASPLLIEDDFPKSITNRPILTAAKTTFTSSEDVNRQVSESLSTGLSLYELDAEALAKLKPDFVVTQVSSHACR
jgi:ABC-type Fe3+-hydroxamate transport system substrate-binding protein